MKQPQISSSAHALAAPRSPAAPIALLLALTAALGLARAAHADPAGLRPVKAQPKLQRVLKRPARPPRAHRQLKKTAATPPCAGLGALPMREGGLIPGEEASYDISIAGAHIGRMDAKVGTPQRIKGHTVIPLFGRARTTLLISAFQSMVGRHQSHVEPSRLLPYSVQADSTYGGDPRWERVHFKGGEVDIEYLMKGKERKRQYRRGKPAMDIVSAAYSARRLKLSEGMHACQEVYGVRRLWRMEAKVVGSAKLRTLAGPKQTYKVQISFDRMPTPGLRRKNPPHVDMTVYITKDDAQLPVAFEATMQGVTAHAKLSRWKLPK